MEQQEMFEPKIGVPYAASLLGISPQAIHKNMRTKGIIIPKINNKFSYITNSIAPEIFKLRFHKKRIAFHIVKGGTGKTTAIHNISCSASTYGAKILLIDLDPQGNLTDTFNVNCEDKPVFIDIISNKATLQESIVSVTEGIDLIPSRIENVILDNKLALERRPLHTLFQKILKSVEDNYDYIFIDCPPTMGHSVTAASLYTKMILTPLNPDKFSAKGLLILKEEIESMNFEFGINIDYRVFLNKFSGNTILSDKAIATTISKENQQQKALKTAVRHSQEIPNIIDSDLTLFSSIKKSTAREDFDILTRELLDIDVLEQRQQRIEQAKNHKA